MSCVILCYALLVCVVLCCGELCYVLCLCCVVLCCGELSCVMSVVL